MDERGNILVAGASGLVGQALLEVLATERAGHAVHILVRRPLTTNAAVVQYVADFDHLDLIDLPQFSEFYCCIGTTIKVAGSREAFYKVDHDIAIASAKIAHDHGATHAALVSAAGSNPRAFIYYSRVKGATEADFIAQGFETTVIVRPSFLAGEREAIGQPARTFEKVILTGLDGPLGALMPNSLRPVTAHSVARAMVAAMARGKAGVTTVENAEIVRFAHAG